MRVFQSLSLRGWRWFLLLEMRLWALVRSQWLKKRAAGGRHGWGLGCQAFLGHSASPLSFAFPDVCRNNSFSLAYRDVVRIKTLTGLGPTAEILTKNKLLKTAVKVLMWTTPKHLSCSHAGGIASSWHLLCASPLVWPTKFSYTAHTDDPRCSMCQANIPRR